MDLEVFGFSVGDLPSISLPISICKKTRFTRPLVAASRGSRSFAQLDRFQLQDGDVVGAEVRPPRSKAQRFSGEFQGTQDEHSWVP